MSFTGEFRHTIDSKGRLIVPSRLRDELEENKLVLTVYAEPCISLWSGPGWVDFTGQLQALQRREPASRVVIRKVFGKAHKDTVDKQGRISIPQHLRDWAGIERDVMIVGAGDHAEIWNPQRYEVEDQKAEEQGLASLFGHIEI